MNKIHYLVKSGRGIDDEWFAVSACRRTENSKYDWEGTHEKKEVTCNICLKYLKNAEKI